MLDPVGALVATFFVELETFGDLISRGASSEDDGEGGCIFNGLATALALVWIEVSSFAFVFQIERARLFTRQKGMRCITQQCELSIYPSRKNIHIEQTPQL